MPDHQDQVRLPGMDRQIFNLNLSVTATSAYILAASLLNQGQTTNYANLRDRWTVSEAELKAALAELVDRKVLIVMAGADEDDTLYSPQPASLWR